MGGHINVSKFLIEQGANVKATDNEGKTPYDYALEEEHEDVAEYILTMKLNEDDISEEEIKLVVKVKQIFMF